MRTNALFAFYSFTHIFRCFFFFLQRLSHLINPTFDYSFLFVCGSASFFFLIDACFGLPQNYVAYFYALSQPNLVFRKNSFFSLRELRLSGTQRKCPITAYVHLPLFFPPFRSFVSFARVFFFLVCFIFFFFLTHVSAYLYVCLLVCSLPALDRYIVQVKDAKAPLSDSTFCSSSLSLRF